MNNKEKGNLGELLAALYLMLKGYKILERNYLIQGGEIDIIANDGKTLVFVEVKKRKDKSFAGGAEFVDAKKQKKIISTAMLYVQKKELECDMRFDVIEINSNEINHIKNAFFC